MQYKQQTLDELSQKSGSISSKQALVGFDGFIDELVTPVDERQGPGDQYTAIDSISEFSKRVENTAGVGTNIELIPKMKKTGGMSMEKKRA